MQQDQLRELVETMVTLMVHKGLISAEALEWAISDPASAALSCARALNNAHAQHKKAAAPIKSK